MKWTPLDMEPIADPVSILIVLMTALVLTASALLAWGLFIRARGKRRAMLIILKPFRFNGRTTQ